MKEEMVILAIDIGGSKYMVGFVDGKGNILQQQRWEWTEVSQEAIVAQLIQSIRDMFEAFPELAEKTCVGGVTIPGFADPVTGTWVDSDFLPVRDLPLCQILKDTFGFSFYADNDCNACAMAERYFGGAVDNDQFLYLTVSTGIGGALFVENNLYYGAFSHAGEIGLFVVEEYGRPSDTGSVNGIVEMYASGRGLGQNYLDLGGEALPDGRHPGGLDVSQQAQQGNPAAMEALAMEGRYLGRIIANACTMYDCRKVIIGGGISLLFDAYKEELMAELKRICPDQGIEAEPTVLGYSGAFLGAAAMGLRGYTLGSVSGTDGHVAFRLSLQEKVRSELVIQGHSVPCKNVTFGQFLAAPHLSDSGLSLDECLQQAADRLEAGENAAEILSALGHQMGKGLACACVLLDPHEVILSGRFTDAPQFRESVLETLKRETYYRGNLPFAITYE